MRLHFPWDPPGPDPRPDGPARWWQSQLSPNASAGPGPSLRATASVTPGAVRLRLTANKIRAMFLYIYKENF